MKSLIRISLAAGIVATGAAAMGISAHAADMPVKASAVQSDGWYFWVDGSYQAVHLPRFDLGWHHVANGPFADLGPTDGYDPAARGAGVSGAIGHYLPHGTLPAFFGTDTRIGIGASYVNADQSQSGASSPVGLATGFFLPLLDGMLARLPLFCGAPACFTSSTLSTAFSAWSLNGKLTTDYRAGMIVLSPSISIFGGQSHSNQGFAQQQAVVGIPTDNLYTATVDMRWTDIGAKAGLDARADVTPWLAFGLGGSVGVAHRDASLQANDLAVTGGIVTGTSALNLTRSATPFLGNAEARMFVTPWSNVTLKGFVGLNYDSKIPGISSPSFVTVFPTTGLTPAGIKLQAETDYYAGAGLTVKFPP